MIFLKRHKRYMSHILYKQTITKHIKYYYTHIIHISGINIFVRIIYGKNYLLRNNYAKYAYSINEARYDFNRGSKTLITISDRNVVRNQNHHYRRTIKTAKKEKWFECYFRNYGTRREGFNVSDNDMTPNTKRHIELIKTKPLIGICL
jgi:hypothetical protein